MDNITAKIISVVWIVSVQTIVLIQPILVYSQISKMEIITVISNGIPRSSKINCWRTIATRNNLKDAPRILEIKKDIDPT